MRVLTVTVQALGASVALVMLSGCSSGGLPVTAILSSQTQGGAAQAVQGQGVRYSGFKAAILTGNPVKAASRRMRSASFMSSGAVGRPLIFVSDETYGVVDIYPQAGKNQQMVGQITGFYENLGIATDAAANLYVAVGSEVPVYAPPYTKGVRLTLADTGNFPISVAVSRSGVVGVMNFCNAPSCTGPGSISFYPKDSTRACATVADANSFFRPYSGGFDGNGNLFIDAENSSGAVVVGEIAGGCKAKSITLLATRNIIGFPPGGVQVDKAGRIAIEDQTGHVIDIYNPPQNGSLGQPISTTQLSGSTNPDCFAFLASGRELYTGDGSTGVATEYGYPAGSVKNTITVSDGDLAGIAVTPPLVP